MTKKENDKLNLLAEDYGHDSVEEMMNSTMFNSLVPCICMNDGCDATYEYEADSVKGWCEECGTGSVQSCLIILGIV